MARLISNGKLCAEAARPSPLWFESAVSCIDNKGIVLCLVPIFWLSPPPLLAPSSGAPRHL